jgi:membrane protein DedA with SNARE-associated domain
MNLEEMFSHYGYLMLLFGSLGEGTPIMLFGGFAAHRGWLELIPSVIVVGALGNALAQSIWFFGARFAGAKILERRTDWATGAEHIGRLLKKWETPVIVGARFIPGISSAALIAVALSEISAARFLVLNVIGASIWAASFGVLGYILGQAVEGLLGDIKSYEKPVAIALLLATAIWIAWRHFPHTWLVRRKSVEL